MDGSKVVGDSSRLVSVNYASYQSSIIYLSSRYFLSVGTDFHNTIIDSSFFRSTNLEGDGISSDIWLYDIIEAWFDFVSGFVQDGVANIGWLWWIRADFQSHGSNCWTFVDRSRGSNVHPGFNKFIVVGGKWGNLEVNDTHLWDCISSIGYKHFY